MPRVHHVKTSFASGELSPELLGRTDLRAYDNGAQTLRNIFIRPTGAVARRDGLRFHYAAKGEGRLVAMESGADVFLMVFADRSLDVLRRTPERAYEVVAEFVSDWTGEQIKQLSWTQQGDALLIVHPDVPPQRLIRGSAGAWTLSPWSMIPSDQRSNWPHARFAPESVTLQPSATTGQIDLTASAAVFVSLHVGCRFRIQDKEVLITSVISPLRAKAAVKQTLSGTTPVTDWTEQAWSVVRGWPSSICVHQNRLVVGGSRDLTDRVWLSRTSSAFNFDVGEGLDDEAIDIEIVSDHLNTVRHVFSGRHLQVFTSGAEWMLTGDPLTPTNIQASRQTRVGSPVDRKAPPRDVDGATLFASRSGAQVCEFLFTDADQSYQANDVALLAHHLVRHPIDMDYDRSNRLFHVVMSDGSLATLTIFRDEGIMAWTAQETAGRFVSIAATSDQVLAMVRRAAGCFVEAFDPALNLDSAVTLEAPAATARWTGLEHLEGMRVTAVADGAPSGDVTVAGGAIDLSTPKERIEVGQRFAHVIEPLSPTVGLGSRVRPIAITFRLWETAALRIDAGRGYQEAPFRRLDQSALTAAIQPFSGDKTVRVLGWRDGGFGPMWRIEQDAPLHFTLLSVSTAMTVI